MLIQLLTIAQLLKFCLANYTNVSQPRSIIVEQRHVPVMRPLNNKLSSVYHAMTPLQVTEAIESLNTTMAGQPNSV
ncbi:hypothetical protein WUBG_12649 [Wuchereria bancrofti]|uniref:Uncharacterized protein n=1 Tax=Wuchereria bancrofti TaxID=6293 RepID=J9E2R5_WUCBA|nr:hypothetical protein WUBG_12649 [Wuchereria bancrofti]